MAGLKFSHKGIVAEAAKNIVKAFLIANGFDEQTATLYGVFLSETIKGLHYIIFVQKTKNPGYSPGT